MLHIETGTDVSIDQLHRIPVPASPQWQVANASTWQPVQHGVLAQAILEGADDAGYEVRSHSWTTARGGANLFGFVDLDARIQAPGGAGLTIGVRHSNVGDYAVTLAFGARVFVCSNGLLVGEIVVSRKHTSGLDLPRLVQRGFAEIRGAQAQVGAFVTRLEQTPISDDQAARMMIDAGRDGVMAWSKLRRVDAQWREPIHDCFRPRTAWSLYNAFTVVVKDSSPARQMATLRGLRGLFALAN